MLPDETTVRQYLYDAINAFDPQTERAWETVYRTAAEGVFRNCGFLLNDGLGYDMCLLIVKWIHKDDTVKKQMEECSRRSEKLIMESNPEDTAEVKEKKAFLKLITGIFDGTIPSDLNGFGTLNKAAPKRNL
jgi:hypothetical protein